MRLVGHKGADAIAPGNTLESFRAAVEAGVDTIEFDVIWLQDAHLPLEQRHPLVVAHDWADADARTPLRLTEALDAFLEPPLDQVEIDLDLKLPGREEEVVEALRERDLLERRYCDDDCECCPSNFEPMMVLNIADCNEAISLEFDVDTPEGRENSLHKLDTLEIAVRVFRDALVAEFEPYDRREEMLESLRG